MQILFLCGGLGTRLREISDMVPKGLIKINGKPFFDYILKSLKKYNPDSLHFCLGYKSQSYLQYIEKLKYKFKITYSCEDDNNLLGTGGAIKKAINFLNNDFIVQYGDTVLDFDYNLFYKHHLENKKSMTMTILSKNKSPEKPNIFCTKNKKGKLKCIYNKNEPLPNSNYIDYGALAFKRSIFEIEQRIKFDLSEVQYKLSKNNDASFMEVDNNYIEIGTPISYNKAKSLLI